MSERVACDLWGICCETEATAEFLRCNRSRMHEEDIANLSSRRQRSHFRGQRPARYLPGEREG